MAVQTHAYGVHGDQVADLFLPPGEMPVAGWPVVVLLHGGFWRERYRRDLMAPLAADLIPHGIAAWNVEYRRVRGAGGWPETFEDVAAAIDHLGAPELPVDASRVAVVGHSAGGHLALWAAGRSRLPATAPGSQPRVTTLGAVGLAPVADLRECDALGLSDGAARELLGGAPDEMEARWDLADPMRWVGPGVPMLLVHGLHDEDVPVQLTRRYAAAARAAGAELALVTPPCGHMELIDPRSPSWAPVRSWITGALDGGDRASGAISAR